MTKRGKIKILARKGTRRAYFAMPVSQSVPKFTLLLSLAGEGTKLTVMAVLKGVRERQFDMAEIELQVMEALRAAGVKREDLPKELIVIAHQKRRGMTPTSIPRCTSIEF
jgi:hypothetical protein